MLGWICLEKGREGAGRGSRRPGGIDRLSAKTTLIIYLFISFAVQALLKASLLGCDSSPTSSDAQTQRGRGCHPPREALQGHSGSGPLGSWARESESAGIPPGVNGVPGAVQANRVPAAAMGTGAKGWRVRETQRGHSHSPPMGSFRDLGSGPPEAQGRGTSHRRVLSPPPLPREV